MTVKEMLNFADRFYLTNQDLSIEDFFKKAEKHAKENIIQDGDEMEVLFTLFKRMIECHFELRMSDAYMSWFNR